MGDHRMRVCYFGTYRADYSRNQIMIEGLRRNDVEVVECHVPLWHGIEDRVEVASGGWLRPSFIARVLRTYWELLRRYLGIGDYDVMVLGYPGQVDVYLARILTWLRRKPLVLDVFMSIHLIAEERGLIDKHPATGELIRWAEKLACRLPDRLISDTQEYVTWFRETYGVDPDRFRLVPTGADDRIFHPRERTRDDGVFTALYYGTFIPNHGVEYIVEAANILKDEHNVRFELIGTGPTKAQAVTLAKRYGLDNISFVGWVDKTELPNKIAEVDVCLGAFSETSQSIMTVQNKIYEGLAMGKPVIGGDSPAVRRSLVDREHLYLCERANPASLAKAVLFLYQHPELQETLAEKGLALFRQSFTLKEVGRRFATHLQALLRAERTCTSYSS